jgi:2-methylisocitrate lyase-like PEP mutase family enzyme
MLKRSLAKRLKERRILVAPGVFDMVSLKLADAMGFEALYVTGYGVVASHLGLPDAGLATYTEMVARVGAMAAMAAAPLIADGDTGYGGLINIRHTVRGYEAAGAAAIQLEDQEFPKKCGHTPGRRVIAVEDMRRRIEVAVEARSDPEFLIVARTDARSSFGLDEALRRGEAYVKAGADVLFIESPESETEMARIGRSFDVPLLANMVEGGRTPLLPARRLEELGFRIAIFPVAGLLAAAAALQRVYRRLSESGSSAGGDDTYFPFAEFNKLMGFEYIWEFERKHAEPPKPGET